MRAFVNHLVFSNARGYRLTRHAFFWLSYLVVFQVMDLADHGFRAVGEALCYIPFNMLFVYFVLYRLVPRLLMKSAYWPFFFWYCALVLVCLTINYLWSYFVVHRERLVAGHLPARDLPHALLGIFDVAVFTIVNVMSALGVGIMLFKFWRREVWQKLQVRQEKTKAELELLRAKLHPHFLFNTLNNLYTLVIERSEKAPQMLMRLSAILSYVLYECQSPEVPLEREISICKDYIELERERFGERLDVSLDFSGPVAGRMIAPMLFQPFIESAFLQGMADREEKVWMSIEMSVLHNQLFFRVINSADADEDLIHVGSAAAGVENAIRRLDLLYPDRYKLSREAAEGVYIVSLTID